MGTKYSSSNEDVSLYIDMPRSQYTVGGAISGVVQMLVKNPFQPVTLDLQIYGKEKTHWEVHTDKVHMVFQGNKVHIDHMIPLVTYHDQVMPGFYKIPFAFIIPQGLPSSFYWNSYAWARIQYKMIAILKLPRKQKELHFDRFFTVADVNDFPKIPEEKYVEDKKNVHGCWCFSRGQAKLACTFQKNGLYVDQQISTQLFIDNQHCSATIKKIQFFLHQKIFLRSSSSAKLRQTFTVAKREFPGLGKRQRLQEGELRILELDLKEFITVFLAKRKKYIKQAYKDFGNFFLQTTTHSKYIDCSYFIVIRPVYDITCQKCCCSTVPRIIHPIVLARSREDPIDLPYAQPQEFTVYEGVPIIQEVPQEAYPAALIPQGYVPPPVFVEEEEKKFGQNRGLMYDYQEQQRIDKGMGEIPVGIQVSQAPQMSNFDIIQDKEDEEGISRIKASQNLDNSNAGMHFKQ